VADCLFDGRDIKSVVRAETGILRGDHRANDGRRNPIDRRPAVIEALPWISLSIIRMVIAGVRSDR